MTDTPNKTGPECRHARLYIGGDPGALPRDVLAHVETCSECRRFRDETVMLDGRLRAALELPLNRFAAREAPAAAPIRETAPPRRFALAASIALALLLAGGAWVFRPQTAIADEIVKHVAHEASSWDLVAPVSATAVAEILRSAGVELDSGVPVTYASSCPFRGRRVPHLVVQTREGPMTVMLLTGEKISQRREFSEEGYRGVLLPSGENSIALLARGTGAAPDLVAGELVSAIRWR
jgi:hypothetical protein